MPLSEVVGGFDNLIPPARRKEQLKERNQMKVSYREPEFTSQVTGTV